MSLINQLNGLLRDTTGTPVEDTWEILRQRITVLSERVWEGRNRWPDVEAWLGNFDGRSGLDPGVERLHALFLLSQFLFIGSIQTRVLLQAVYRDLFLIPLIQEVRAALGGTRDLHAVRANVNAALQKTRFLGVGNPSESGVHLLYYFRQENGLPKNLFLDSLAMFTRTQRPDGTVQHALANPDVDRYVFVDDVCGSGETALEYSRNILTDLVGLKPDAKLSYLAMFASRDGMELVRAQTCFGDNSGAVFELDESYKCLSEGPRILRAAPEHIEKDALQRVAMAYGRLLCPEHPGGFNDNQLLLGFHHNTPDNTLPIMWQEGSQALPWIPAFKRYPKI
jgi:hypothetical protein